MMSEPALAKASRKGSHGAIIRCVSNVFLLSGRIAFTRSGPKEILGTKCPSITSRWIQSAPAASTARTSSPNLAKSAARIDGAMISGRIFASGCVRLTRWRRRGNAPAHGLLTRQSARGGTANIAGQTAGPAGAMACRARKTGTFGVPAFGADFASHVPGAALTGRSVDKKLWSSSHVHVSRRNVQCANLFPAFPKPVGGRQRRIGRYRSADSAVASDVVHIHFQPGEPGRRRGQFAAARRQQQRR